MKPALKTDNNVKATLKTSVSTTAKAFVFETGHGAGLPQPINGTTDDTGNSTTLELTGVGALSIGGKSIALLDEIWNVSDGSHALVLAINTDSITTTPLRDGTANTWANGDEFTVNPFVLTLVRYSADGSSETQSEIVRFYKRDGDQITADASGRAMEGTTALEWAPGDYAELRNPGLLWETQKERINYLRKMVEGAVTVVGQKTFQEIPVCSVVPSSPSHLVNKQYVDDNTGGGFSLSGTRPSAFMPRKLEWGDTIDTGNYEIYRNDVLISTVSNSVNNFTDSDIVTGDLIYKVKAVSGGGIELTSNTVTFKSNSNSAIVAGEYGDGSDGAYTTGEISGKNIYQFTDFTPTSGTKNLVNDKETFIFVDGNLTLDALTVLALQGGSNGESLTSISVDGNSEDISTGAGTAGAGGNGGTGENGTPNYANCYRYGAAGGAGNAAGGAGNAAGGGGGGGGAGGNSGYYASSVAICPTTGGASTGATGGTGGAGAGRTTLANQFGGPGGNGGNAGANTSFQHSVVFIVSGNVTLPTGSQVTGSGLTGASGSNGSEGGVTSNYQGGTGGGGGGTGGTNGAKIKIFHAGSATNSATVIVNGGTGGAGGTSSAGASGGGAGTAGSTGGTGTVGSLELIQL